MVLLICHGAADVWGAERMVLCTLGAAPVSEIPVNKALAVYALCTSVKLVHRCTNLEVNSV